MMMTTLSISGMAFSPRYLSTTRGSCNFNSGVMLIILMIVMNDEGHDHDDDEDALVGYLFLVSSASSFLISSVLDLKLCLFLTLKNKNLDDIYVVKVVGNV